MSDPFFSKPKRKSAPTPKALNKQASVKKTKNLNPSGNRSTRTNLGKKRKFENNDSEEDSITSSEDEIGPGNIDDMDMEHDFGQEDESGENEEEIRETPTEKRRRLAKQYIESVAQEFGIYINA